MIYDNKLTLYISIFISSLAQDARNARNSDILHVYSQLIFSNK